MGEAPFIGTRSQGDTVDPHIGLCNQIEIIGTKSTMYQFVRSARVSYIRCARYASGVYLIGQTLVITWLTTPPQREKCRSARACAQIAPGNIPDLRRIPASGLNEHIGAGKAFIACSWVRRVKPPRGWRDHDD